MLELFGEIEFGDLFTRLDKIPVVLRNAIRTELSDAAGDAVQRMTRESLHASSPNNRTLVRRSGALIRSFRHRTRTSPDSVTVEIYQLRGNLGAPLGAKPYIYGPMLEYGGIIRPVNRQWLTIPIAAEARGRRARSFRDLFFVGRDATHAVLARRRPGTRAGIEVVYALRKSVRIVGRGYFGRMVAQFRRDLPKRLRDAGSKAIRLLE